MTIRVGGYAPPGSPHSRAVDHFTKTLRALADHPVEVIYNVMDDGKPATALLDMVANGELTWCYFSTSYLGWQVSALNALEVPFLFTSLTEAHAALDGEFGAALSDATGSATPFEVLGYWDNGFRHFTNRLRDVRSPNDVAGMRVRLQPNPLHEALIRSWGGGPVPAELSEGLALITSGTVDAQENPLANTAAYGVDHQHITMSGHLYGARGLYANRAQMQSFGSQLGNAVRQAATAAIRFQRIASAEYEQELRTRFEAEGRTIVDLTDSERAEFKTAAAEVIETATTHHPLIKLLYQEET